MKGMDGVAKTSLLLPDVPYTPTETLLRMLLDKPSNITQGKNTETEPHRRKEEAVRQKWKRRAREPKDKDQSPCKVTGKRIEERMEIDQEITKKAKMEIDEQTTEVVAQPR